MSGVLFGKQKTDWIGSVDYKLKKLIDGYNWDTYRPIHETQNNPETWGCLLFSGLDCIETLFMYHLHNRLIPPSHVKWLTDNKYFITGFINFSEAYNYQFSDIQEGSGTHMYKANDAIRMGLIPEQLYSFNDYFVDGKPITDDLENLREEFKKRFTINWYWVEDISEALQSSPLQATVKYGSGDGILKPEGKHNHGIMVYNQNGYYSIDDSYTQRDKKYDKNYVSNFIGYSLTINYSTMDVQKFIKDNDLRWIRNSNTGAFGRILQGKLRIIKTKDRGAMILLDDKIRQDGVNIINADWEQLPKEDF